MTLIYEPRTLLFEVIQPIDVILPSEMDDVHIETVQKGEKNPRIILLGWLGSQMKYLNKYSKLWNEMNCTTINVIDTRNFFRQFFVPGRRAEVSAIILKQLAKGKIFITL